MPPPLAGRTERAELATLSDAALGREPVSSGTPNAAARARRAARVAHRWTRGEPLCTPTQRSPATRSRGRARAQTGGNRLQRRRKVATATLSRRGAVSPRLGSRSPSRPGRWRPLRGSAEGLAACPTRSRGGVEHLGDTEQTAELHAPDGARAGRARRARQVSGRRTRSSSAESCSGSLGRRGSSAEPRRGAALARVFGRAPHCSSIAGDGGNVSQCCA